MESTLCNRVFTDQLIFSLIWNIFPAKLGNYHLVCVRICTYSMKKEKKEKEIASEHQRYYLLVFGDC